MRLPLSASATATSCGGIGQPAASSNSVDSESFPSGSLSPTLMVISGLRKFEFLGAGSISQLNGKVKMLAGSGRGAIFPAMQIAAEARQDHRLTLAEVLQALVAEGLVPKDAADKLTADRRLHRGDHHPLTVIADQKWRSA